MNRTPPDPSPRRPRWLCVAYAFPPINRSGTHRTLAFVRHLDSLGWEATVLTVDPDGEPIDESLLDCVPASTTVVRTACVDLIAGIKTISEPRALARAVSILRHEPRALARAVQTLRSEPRALARAVQTLRSEPRASARAVQTLRSEPRASARAVHRTSNRRITAKSSSKQRSLRDWITRFLVTPDSRAGWVVPAVRAGMRVIRRCRPNVVYSTSPCMSAHLIALILSRSARLPWVADFRDPWRGNPFRDLGYRSLERWDAWLEWLVLHRAAHVICNTEPMKEDLCRRLPMVANKCTTIMNGFDAEQVERLTPKRNAAKSHFVLTHCGQFYGPRSPKVWFAALRRVIEQSPILSSSIHMELIGAESFDGRSLMELASEAGVGDHVHVLGHKGHAETLSYMAGSDALMLAGSAGVGCDLQVPGKLFEYLAVRKPIIAAVSPDSPAVDILTRARAEALICEPNDEQGLAAAITQLAKQRHVPVEDAWAGVETFNRARCGETLAVILARAAGLRASKPVNNERIGSLLRLHVPRRRSQ